MSYSFKRVKMTSTVKPIKMWIDGNCFQIVKTPKKVKKDALPGITENRDTDKLLCNIKSNEEGKFFTNFRLPSWYYIKLLNPNTFSVQTLEDKTQTKIVIPKYGNDGDVGISGESLDNVLEARLELQSAAAEMREKSTPLQFTSIPVLSDEIKERFILFRDEISNSDTIIDGMDATIFQKEVKLHLTVSVFTLVDNTEKEEAIKVLNDYKTDILDPLIQRTGPLKIKVAGIDCMTNNHLKAHVLYANAELANKTDDLSLQSIVNGISHYFYERGLAKRYEENIKLHVTLINSKYRKSPDDLSPKKWSNTRKSFNAKPIIDKYKDFMFGEVDFDQIHLSCMSVYGEDGYYKPLAVIKV